INVVDMLLKKTSENLKYSNAFSSLFAYYSEASKALREIFKRNLDLLKRAYFIAMEANLITDYGGQILAHMIILDPSFFLEYVDWIYSTERQFDQYDRSCDYSFLWKRDDYEVLMQKVFELRGSLDKSKFFKLKFKPTSDDPIRERQDRFLKRLIEQKYEDSLAMQSIFHLVLIFPFERRQSLLAIFLEHNKKFEDFKSLPFEPNSHSWTGSPVPMYQGYIEYHESLLPLLNTVDFLQHKQYIERQIQEYRKKIEEEKKKEFMRG
ncbi:MAG: hypothetical protein WCA07_02905, partial [Gloeobacterales cyanobacterium]